MASLENILLYSSLVGTFILFYGMKADSIQESQSKSNKVNIHSPTFLTVNKMSRWIHILMSAFPCGVADRDLKYPSKIK